MSTSSASDLHFLQEALAEATLAAKAGEVPVGAVVVKDGGIISRAHNLKETESQVTHHAELLAIQRAADVIGDWRLNGCTLYSTLEPCPMCAGAILHARFDRVVFGAKDLKWGGAGTIVDLFQPGLFNHTCKIEYVSFLKSEELLKSFFAQIRK